MFFESLCYAECGAPENLGMNKAYIINWRIKKSGKLLLKVGVTGELSSPHIGSC